MRSFTPEVVKFFEIAGKNARVFNHVATDKYGTGQLTAQTNPDGSVKGFTCICLPHNRSGSAYIGTEHEYPRVEITFRPEADGSVGYAVNSVKYDEPNHIVGQEPNRNIIDETRLSGTTEVKTAQDALFLTEELEQFVDHLLYCKKIADDIGGKAWL